jgi:hypothetical protein
MNTPLETIVPSYVDLETERTEIEKTVAEVFRYCSNARANGDMTSPVIAGSSSPPGIVSLPGSERMTKPKRCDVMQNFDPPLGKYIQSGPIKSESGIDTYEYVANNHAKGVGGHPDSQRIEHDRAGKATPLAGFVSKSFKSILKKLFPIGYEDEAGFHYGSP